nr:hypothetical protein [uncultured Chryseobacterium sp.]
MVQYTQYIFLNKRIAYILLFLFSAIKAQKLTITNNTDNPIIVKDGKKEVTINSKDKKEFNETNTAYINVSNDFHQNIILFLEPTEKLNIAIEKDQKFVYTGDQAALHEYINERLTLETFGKTNIYYNIEDKKNIGELKNTSELLLLDILKKSKISNILITPEDKNSVKRVKTHIKDQWLYTLFLTFDRANLDNAFKKEAINYYFKKYIEPDIAKYNCSYSLRYLVIKTLAKNKSLLQAELPMYPIIEHTDDDEINQYLPQNCQREYFRNKYKYLEHINGHNKEYYKKVLIEKFNDK